MTSVWTCQRYHEFQHHHFPAAWHLSQCTASPSLSEFIFLICQNGAEIPVPKKLFWGLWSRIYKCTQDFGVWGSELLHEPTEHFQIVYYDYYYYCCFGQLTGLWMFSGFIVKFPLSLNSVDKPRQSIFVPTIVTLLILLFTFHNILEEERQMG